MNKRTRTLRSTAWKSRILHTSFLLPAIVLMMLSVYIPFAWNGILSFQEWNGFMPATWNGIQNYVSFFKDPTALKSLKNSFFLAVVSTAGAVLLGLFLASVVYKLGKREGAFCRLIIFLPVMLPTAVVGLLFTFVFNPEMGLLNNLLEAIGLSQWTKAWLENEHTVLWCIAIVNIWKMTGLTMMLSFASMQMLPDSIFESSRMEGASYPRQLISIVFPLIKPTVLMAATYSLVVNFKSYDMVFVMTRGGPGTTSQTIPIMMMKSAFNFNEFGYSAGQGMILAAVVMVTVLIVQRLLKGETYEY